MAKTEQTVSKPRRRRFPNPKNLDERAKLDLDIAKVESEINENQRRNRSRIWMVLGLTVFSTLAFYFLGTFLPVSPAFRNPVLWISFGLSYGLLSGGVMYFSQQSRLSAFAKADLDLLNARKRILYQLAPVEKLSTETEPASVSYFDSLVRVNVENLAEYYSLIKVHTDNSFRVSIIAGCIGFFLIVLGLGVGFVNDARTEIVAYISSGSGIVVEFIAGIFFYLYNRTVNRLKEYHDSLLAVENILLSFKIVGDIQEEKEKVKMMGQMLVFLIGKKDFVLPSTSETETKKNNL